MNALSLIKDLSLVEGLIYGFIACNMLLSGAFLLQCGVKKVVDRRAGR